MGPSVISKTQYRIDLRTHCLGDYIRCRVQISDWRLAMMSFADLISPVWWTSVMSVCGTPDQDRNLMAIPPVLFRRTLTHRAYEIFPLFNCMFQFWLESTVNQYIILMRSPTGHIISKSPVRGWFSTSRVLLPLLADYPTGKSAIRTGNRPSRRQLRLSD